MFGGLRWLVALALVCLGLPLAWAAGNTSEPKAGPWVTQAQGARHTLGVDATGQAWAWGDNSSGQLGLGHSRPVADASRVLGLPARALAVSAGTQHSAALLADGSVWVWGANNRGQLGREPIDVFTIQTTPVRVAGLKGVLGLSGGADFVLALVVSTGKVSKEKKGRARSVLRWGAGDAQATPVSGHKVALADVGTAKAGPMTTPQVAAVQTSPQTSASSSAPSSVASSIPPSALPSISPSALAPVAVRPDPLEASRAVSPERAVAQPAVTTASATPSAPALSTTPLALPAVTISGVVRLSSGLGRAATGEALAHVQVSADGAQCMPTDGQGRYACVVPAGWSGRVRASHNNYQFSPSTLSFSQLRFDAGQQNFAALYDPR